MKKTVIVSAILTSVTMAAVAQDAVRQVSSSRLLTAEQMAKIEAENPNIKFNQSATSQVISSPNMNAGSALRIEDEASLRAQVPLKGIFTNVGVPDANLGAPLEGYAKDLPLIEVLKQVIPEGWKATAVKNANVNQRVSWEGGQTWDKTLQKVTEDNGLYISVNWPEKTVRVLDNSQVAVIHRANEKVAVIDFGSNSSVVSNVAAVGPAPVQLQTWSIKTGTLKENLEAWGEKSGFKLVYADTVANYSLDDFPVQATTLDGESGALAKLAARFVEGKVKQPLEFDYKTGGTTPVLIIKNKNYEQRFFKDSGSAPTDAEEVQ